MATLNLVQLSGSRLNSKTIHKSKLRDCILIRVTLYSSDVADSVLKHCIIHDCVINSSKLFDCKIYGDKFMLRCEFEGFELLPSQPTLSKLPVEIREMIFKLSLSGTWHGKTPGLLVALRGQEELYCQALEIFQKSNRFFLSNISQLKLFKSMPEKVLSNVRMLSIGESEIPKWSISSDYLQITDLNECFEGCKGLTDLRFVINSNLSADGLTDLTYYWAYSILHQCRSLKKFAMVSSQVGRPANFRLGRQVSEMSSLKGSTLKFATIIERFSYKLSVDTKEVLILSANGSSRLWIWEAEAEEVLIWKDY